MSLCKRVRYLHSDIYSFFQIKRLILNSAGQGLAFNVLHNDKGVAIFFADLVNGTDVWVVKLGCGLCLSDEAFLCLLISD